MDVVVVVVVDDDDDASNVEEGPSVVVACEELKVDVFKRVTKS